jgi:hypothetical protein
VIIVSTEQWDITAASTIRSVTVSGFAPVRTISDDSRSISAKASSAVVCSLISVDCRASSGPHGCTTLNVERDVLA